MERRSFTGFVKQHKRWFFMVLGVVAVFALTFFILAEVASRGAAYIFNREISRQDMLRGTITVEKIKAHVNGDVSIENLVWKDRNGNLILQAPEGGFHVRPLDVVMRNFKSTTVQKLYLKDALISVRFNENMQVDFINPAARKKLTGGGSVTGENEAADPGQGESSADSSANKTKQLAAQKRLEEGLKNFNRNGRKLRLNLILDRCRLEAYYRNRHYVFHQASLNLDLNTEDVTKIVFESGKLGGTMLGGGMTIDGLVDFRGTVPATNIDVAVREVDPSSLGFGLNVHDKMTLVAKFQGPVTQPVGTGTVRMQELHIPALYFTDVIGDIVYEDSVLKFSDVHAEIYRGKLVARGDYNLDTREYNIYGKGTELDSRLALNDLRFSCLVDMNIILRCDGNPRNTLTYGDFKSGKGRYSLIPFDSIQGRFSNQYKELGIYDVLIATPFGDVSTNALYISNGKLKLGRITLTDQGTGEAVHLK